jgi:hypothetical protein
MTHLPVGCFERLSLVSEYFTKKDRGPLTGLGIFGNLSAAWTGSNRHLPDFISSVYIVQVVSFSFIFLLCRYGGQVSAMYAPKR